MSRSVLRPTLLALALGGLVGPAWTRPGGIFAGTFEPGLRWIDGASLSDAWIPSSVAFGAGDELVWCATQGEHRKLLLLATPGSGVVSPVYHDRGVASASTIIDVASGAGGERLFSLAQFPEPDLFHRRTIVARYSALQMGTGDTFSPEWSAPFPFVANGPALFAVDRAGDTLVVAAYNNQTGMVQVRWLDASIGGTVHVLDLAGAGLDAMAFSGDGQRTAISLGARLVILGPNATLLHDETLPTAALSLAFSLNGSRMVAGRLGALRLYDETGPGYNLTHSIAGSSNEIASRVALSADGSTYAAAWWRYRTVDELRLEVYDGVNHNVLNQVVQSGYVGSLQNAPVGVEMTDDGSRIAFASWGRGDLAPEVFLLERGQPLALLEIDLPGSAMGIALNEGGTALAVVTKNLHANQFGSTGEVRLYSTGEPDVALTAPARLGQQLEVASHAPGASMALFMIGQRATTASHPAGTLGSLWLLRNDRLQVTARPVDSAGEANWAMPVPASAAWLGVELSVQVAKRIGGQLRFSETVLDPLFY